MKTLFQWFFWPRGEWIPRYTRANYPQTRAIPRVSNARCQQTRRLREVKKGRLPTPLLLIFAPRRGNLFRKRNWIRAEITLTSQRNGEKSAPESSRRTAKSPALRQEKREDYNRYVNFLVSLWFSLDTAYYFDLSCLKWSSQCQNNNHNFPKSSVGVWKGKFSTDGL